MSYDSIYEDEDGQAVNDQRPNPANWGSAVEELRREVASLKEALTGVSMDSAEENVVAENRRLLFERGERDTRAAAAANDPATLEALRRIETPEELEIFLKANGG